MSATSDELTLIRMAIGDTSSATFSDSELQALWTDVATDYNTSTERKLIRYQVVIDAIEVIMVDAAKRTTYRAGSSQENLSDVFKHLKELHDRWSAKLSKATAATKSSARIGTLYKKPSRLKEWPDA